ncbi:MAG TPA: hypothetical protein VG604_01430 [Candidatus Saccharimonadales bacterium]|nr:hypothetical protein [Candidatus Saccharimonadales bacterium]
MKKNQKGFGAVEALVIFIVIVLFGAIAWRIHSRESLDNAAKPAPTAHALTNYKQYKDTSVGLSFSYPSRWGMVLKHKVGDPDRQVPNPNNQTTQYDYTFSAAPLFILPVANGDDNYMEDYSGCFTSLVLLNLFPTTLKAGDWKQSKTSVPNQYTTYKKVLIGNHQTTMIMDFEASTVVNSQDYCNGLSVYGAQLVSGNPQGLQKIDFLWSQTATNFGKDQPARGLQDLADFKQNQSKYISAQDLNDLQATIKSIQTF